MRDRSWSRIDAPSAFFIGLVWVVGIVMNLALLAGAVWVVVWVLRTMGVIA